MRIATKWVEVKIDSGCVTFFGVLKISNEIDKKKQVIHVYSDAFRET